jgi:hypothetical protein
MNDTEDSIERALRAEPLRPGDPDFTRRVLSALPQRARSSAVSRGSFALASRAGLALAVLVAAQRWYSTGMGDADTVIAILLFAAPAFAAVAKLCGPVISRSKLEDFRRGARHWR